MTTTRGERATARAEFRAARRRRAFTLLPGVAVALWALADLVAGRHARLSALETGFFGHVLDHIQPVAWTLVAVVAPYLVAVKPKPKRTGAIIALFAGPVLSPLLFGAGGWRLWQIAALAGLVLVIEGRAPAPARRQAGVVEAEPYADEVSVTAAPAPAPESFDESLQAISGAPFQRRSSS